MGTGKLCDECEADQAALNLLHMKQAKLDEKTSMTLHELQRKTHALLPIQTLNPRDFPPVTSLRGFIAMCSTPYWKKLTQTDMREDQARLIISKRFAEIYLLPLLNKYEDVGKGISVTVYDMNGKIFQMTFKLWTNKVYDDFETSVTLWMFRHVQTRKLCFVISPEKSSVIESSKRSRD
ncbi:putative B3 domain-containing protein At4g03170 [Fagus crenata]